MDRVIAVQKIKPHIILPILVVLSILFLIYIFDIRSQQKEQLSARFSQSVQSTSRHYNSLLEERTNLLVAALNHIHDKSDLATLFINQDRDRLYEKSSRIFDHLNREHGVTHFYYHSLDGRNYLRVHQKDRFGDEITRTTMQQAMLSGNVTQGVELGPLGTLTLRVVLPWRVGGKLVGYLELGVEVDAVVQGVAKDVDGQLYTVVWKDGIERSSWEQGMAMLGRKAEWEQFSNGVISSFSKPMKRSEYVGYLEKMVNSEEDILPIWDDNGFYYIGHVPLLDIGGNQRGMIVMLKNMTDELHGMNEATQRLAVTSAGLGCLLIIVFYIMTERLERRLGTSQEQISSEVQARLSMQAKHIEQLEYMSLYDPLTNLPNRQLLLEYVRQEMRASDRRKGAFALVLLDIKRLKEINNTLGHVCGDALLSSVGLRLKDMLRDSDIVARVEGDEFAIILPSVTQDYVIRMAEKIGGFFAAPFVLDDVSVDIDVVLGIAVYPEHGDNEGMLLQRADIAVRQAKEINRPYCFYNADQDQFTFDRVELFGDLRRAISTDNELQVYYQPKVEVHTGQVIGAEALVRWMHPTKGMISPATFIPLAEHTGLIAAVTDRVLSEVAKNASSWCDVHKQLCVSVNLSVQNLLDDKLPEKLIALLDNPDLKGCSFILELTETSIMRDLEMSKQIMLKLHDHGFKFSIDDFGTGYSSLSYLSQLPVAELKIDQSFVRNVLKSKSDSAIVKSTIDLAHGLGLSVCAEGVEEIEILERLRLWDCDVAQGFLISRPLPQDQFLHWLDVEYSSSDLCLACVRG